MMAQKDWFRVTFYLCLMSQMYVVEAGEQCNSHGSVDSKALKDHTFRSLTVKAPYECVMICESDHRCQSYNYVIQGRICELNNRTKDAKPEKFVTDPDRFYMTRDNRVPLSSIPELPAESCKEIKASEGGEAVSRFYWLDSTARGEATLVYCDMQTEAAVYCMNHKCQNNATCVNRLVNYTCLCGQGWLGTFCETGETIEACNNSLGMENYTIPDSSLTASSMYTLSQNPGHGRLNFDGWAWAAKVTNKQQWFQAKFGNWTWVTAISTQGNQGADDWIKTYKISSSYEGLFFKEYKEDDINTKVFDGNSDRNTVVRNSLAKSLVTQFIRIIPVSWNGWISLRAEFYGCRSGFDIPETTIPSAFGMANGVIPDSNIVATSEVDQYNGPQRGRLNMTSDGSYKGGWKVKQNNLEQFLQIDLGNVSSVTGIATQGNGDSNQCWVTSYTLAYSDSGWNFLSHNGGEEFQGNMDRGTAQGNVIDPPIIARFIQIRPTTWNIHICLRVELYGSSNATTTQSSRCDEALGMQHGQIPDSAITASSAYDSSVYPPYHGRLYLISTPVWISGKSDASPWFQVDMGNVTLITGVATQGRHLSAYWVITYTLTYGIGVFGRFINDNSGQRKVFNGNSDRVTVERHYFDKPILAQYVKIIPLEWLKYAAMRTEFYGCRKGIEIPSNECASPLGMENGDIPDSAIVVTSHYNSKWGGQRGRLHAKTEGSFGGGWNPYPSNDKQFLQIDLGNVTKVTAIATQGRDGGTASQWVKSYTLAYSTEEGNFTSYQNGVEFLGNLDVDTVVGQVIEPPIIARFIQVRIKTWGSKITMRIELYGCSDGFVTAQPAVCLKALGMQNKQIPDSAITASSEFAAQSKAAWARLHLQASSSSYGSWSPRHTDVFQWLQVNLSELAKVRRVATQGRQGSDYWVKTFILSYGYDGVFFEDYQEEGSVKVFSANSDRYTVVNHNLKGDIIARHIRFRPKSWQSIIAMRVEVYGCRGDFNLPDLECTSPLGMKSGEIPDQSITALSVSFSQSFSTERARLEAVAAGNAGGGWIPKTSNTKQWIQVDLGNITKIMRIATQGRQDQPQWVTSYSVTYSVKGGPFVSHNQTIIGNTDQNSIVGHIFNPEIIARYIRIHPKSWSGPYIVMRFELYGCRDGFSTPETEVCFEALGMQSQHIPDSAITASSQGGFGASYKSYYARLYFQSNRWQPTKDDLLQWLQVDFSQQSIVKSVSIQGRPDYDNRVTSFSISYSSDGQFFKVYMQHGSKKVFFGPEDHFSVVNHRLDEDIFTRYIRIQPLTWYRAISLRAEFYGCRNGTEPPAMVCESPLGMENGEIPDQAITSSSIYSDHYGGTERSRLSTLMEGSDVGAWRSKTDNLGQWIQVDMGNVTKVTKIATQGANGISRWVTSYSISYSVEGGPFVSYNKDQVIMGNRDRDSITGHIFSPAIVAKYVKIHPKSWNTDIAMRFEFYGCKTGFSTPEPQVCLDALGMQNGDIPNSAITASSVSSYNKAFKARIHSQTGYWKAGATDMLQWLQVNLSDWTKVRGVAIHGRHDSGNWVTNFSLSYSHDGVFFEDYIEDESKKVFSGDPVDQYEVVSHILNEELVARYIRIVPMAWHTAIAMRVEFYGCRNVSPPVMGCKAPLGMKRGKISDQAISASSSKDQFNGPERARIDIVEEGDYGGSWRPKYYEMGQWIQVDLGEITRVTKIATQGHQGNTYWVTSYSISYSVNGEPFVSYRNDQTLLGNIDRESMSGYVFNPAIIAKYIRIHPKTWKSAIAMRFELYGCKDGFDLPEPTICLEALGMQNNDILASAISASSKYSTDFRPANARLHFQRESGRYGAWVPKTDDVFQWLQVSLTESAKVRGVAVQGRHDYDQWVKSFGLSYGPDGVFFNYYKENGSRKMFSGNTDRHNVVTHILQEEIVTRFIRIHPRDWNSRIALRAEFYGCTMDSTPPPMQCTSPLGMKSGEIPDEAITAVSTYNELLSPARARLDSGGAWRSMYLDAGPWIQVDLGQITKITKIATQGRPDAAEWITGYSITYSVKGGPFVSYDNDQIILGNLDQNSIAGHIFSPPIIAQFIQLHPLTWKVHMGIRLELYGCKDGFVMPEVPPCQLQLGLQNGLIPDSALTASSKLSSSYGPENARLHSVYNNGRYGVWMTLYNNPLQWLQVDLGVDTIVTLVATQGHPAVANWVKTYGLSYSTDRSRFTQYQAEEGVAMIFAGNTDQLTVVTNALDPPITARLLRVRPLSWEVKIALRAELYGCKQ